MRLDGRSALNQLDLVTFRRIDERNRATLAIRVRTVRERVTFFGRLMGETFDIVDFEGQMREIRTDDDWTAFIELTDFDFFLAVRRLEENQLRAAAGGMASRFLQAEDVSVERDRFFEVGHAITSVEKLLYHYVTNCACLRVISNANGGRVRLGSGCHPEPRKRRGTSQASDAAAIRKTLGPSRTRMLPNATKRV